jgi:hypothetical protein
MEGAMPTAKDFRRIVLGLRDTAEGAHMGHPDFRVNGRIFASLTQDESRGMVVLTPEQQARFISEYPSGFQPESGAWGRQGCTRVLLASVDEDVLGEAATLARQNIAAKGPARAKSKTASKRARATRARKTPKRARSR